MTPEEAYKKYLEVFPSYWDVSRYSPNSEEQFLPLYKMALCFQEQYEEDLTKGILDPTMRYSKLQFDQFLGIPHTAEELKGAFQLAFPRPKA